MATRFWLTNAAAPYTPATRRGAWDVASGEDVQLLGRRPQGSAGTSSINAGSTAADRDVLLHRSISAGTVKAGTISGTVSWTIGARESNVDCNAVWHLHAYVTSGDSDTPRGTLLADYIGSTEFTTTETGTQVLSQAVSSVAVQVGDRIVVEIGYRAQALVTTYNATINYGNVGATDLSSGSTNVTNEPGWIEFSGADGLFTNAFGTLIDAFTSSIDAKWVKSAGVTATGGRARVPTTTTLETLYTASAYEIQGSQLAFQVPTVPATGGGTGAAVAAYLSAGPTVSTTNLEIVYTPSSGNLQFRNNVGGADGAPVNVTYSPTTHAWWRFKETGGSILMETSPDNSTWTTQRTISTLTQWMRTGILIGYFESQRTSGTADFAELDSVNPAGATTIPVTPAGETETAVPPTRTKRLTITPAGAVETAIAPRRIKYRLITPAVETETATAPGRSKSRTITPAVETETGQAPARSKTRAITPAVESENALQPSRRKTRTVTAATETETARTPGRSKARTITPAGETENAIPPTVPAGPGRDITILAATITSRWDARQAPPRWAARPADRWTATGP
jgi:hypothetical protein